MSPNKLLPLCLLFACSTDVIDHRGQGVSGRPTNPGEIGVLAEGLDHPLTIAVDDHAIYATTGWSVEGCNDDCPFPDGALIKVDFDKNVSTLQLAGERLGAPVSDGTTVFVPGVETGRIFAMPSGGGSPDVLADNLRGPRLLSLENSTLTWVNCGDCGFARAPTGDLARMTETSTAPSIITSGLGFVIGLAIDGPMSFVSRIVMDGMSFAAFELIVLDHQTNTETSLAFTDNAGPVLADETNIYFSDSNGLLRFPRAGGPGVPVAPDFFVSQMVMDETHIYATQRSGANGGVVKRFNKISGAVETVTQTSYTPGAIALDGEYLYWLEIGHPHREDGRIHVMLKP
jgi:hypothetical protein